MKDMGRKNNFALYCLFPEAIAFNHKEIKERIQGISQKEVEITPIVGLDGQDKHLYVHMQVEGEVFDLVGIDAPLPENIMGYTVGCAYGKPEAIQKIKAHRFHIVVFYKGENKDQQAVFNAYKKLTYGFLTQGLLGIANPYSWNIIGPETLQSMIEDKEMSAFAETPAMMIWRNFIKIPYDDGVWFITKGNNLFGIHEYAYYGQFEEAQDIYDIFETAFSYVYEKEGVIQPKDTMQLGENEFIKFMEIDQVPKQLREQLKGETIGTLVIEKIVTSEINS